MSVSTLLNIGARAMNASYAALQTTGNNIANVNTAGYSRQQVELETTYSQRTGSGFFGKGVDVATVTRAHSAFLTREAATTQSLAAADSARASQLRQLETVFRTGEAGLGYAAQTMFNAFADIATRPGDSAARQTALARVDELARRFRGASEQIDAIQRGIADELRSSVGQINAITSRIADLNRRIVTVQGTVHTPNDLLDQRDLAVNDLSKLVQVTTVASADGSVGVFLGGGQKLVLGGDATALAVVGDAFDPAKLQLGVTEGAMTRAFPDGYVAGGSVAGLLRVQNHDLGDARGLLGQLASTIAAELNRQQSLGLDLGNPPSAGAALLAISPPRVAPSTGNAMLAGVAVASYIDGFGVRVPSVSITTVDSRALQPSDYELSADPSLPAGQYRLTRLSDRQTQTVTSGQVVDGFRIDVVLPLPVARDTFRLQPVSTAAASMTSLLEDPRGIAAAAPVMATLPATNTGTAAVRSLAAVNPSINPNLTATLTFTDDLGNYAWSLVDTTGALPTTNGTGSFTPGQPIALNGFELHLAGAPRTGDAIVVAKTAFPAADNGNANAMLALRDAKLVSGQNVTDAYASALASVGVRVQGAVAAADQSESIAFDAREAASSQAGVNLDEEAARLIQFQQSYQAAAKILQIAQSLFDTLLR